MKTGRPRKYFSEGEQREANRERVQRHRGGKRQGSGGAALFNTGCFPFLEGLAAGSVDLILTDPPYRISRETGFAAGNNPAYDRLKVSMQFGEWDHGFDGFARLAPAFYRALKKGGTCIVFWDLWKLTELADMLERAGFKQRRFLEWVKTNPVPLNQRRNYLTNAREVAVAVVKGGNPVFHGAYDDGIYRFPIEHGKQRCHPTQKSQALCEALIEKHSNPGDLVLDCFAGSGTTGAAALQRGRRFVGCEIDPGYYDSACRRLGLRRPAALLP